MRILVIGANGTIGQAVVQLLGSRHDVVAASQRKSAVTVDITSSASILAMYGQVGQVEAIVSVAGKAKLTLLAKITDADFKFCLENKLMGQVNVARLGLPFVRDGGSVTVTSGILSRAPMAGSAAVSLVNAGIEGFARAAALEAPRGIRVNVVSPPWVTETLIAYKMNPAWGRPAAEVAGLYVQAVEGTAKGATLELPGT